MFNHTAAFQLSGSLLVGHFCLLLLLALRLHCTAWPDPVICGLAKVLPFAGHSNADAIEPAWDTQLQNIKTPFHKKNGRSLAAGKLTEETFR